MISKKKKEKNITVAQLAEMMQKEFSIIHQMHQVFVDRFDNLDNEIGQLKMTTRSLVTMVASRDREMRNLDLRLRRVERRSEGR